MGILNKIFGKAEKPDDDKSWELVKSFENLVAEKQDEFADVNELPHSKAVIDLAFRDVLSRNLDDTMRSNIEVTYLSMADFQELSEEEKLAIGGFDLAIQNRNKMDATKLASLIASGSGLASQVRARSIKEMQTYSAVIEALRNGTANV